MAGDDSERARLLKKPMREFSVANLELLRQSVVSARLELGRLDEETNRMLTSLSRMQAQYSGEIARLQSVRDDIKRLEEHLGRLDVDIPLAKYLDDK